MSLSLTQIELLVALLLLATSLSVGRSCRTEREQCSGSDVCCEGLACAPMFVDEQNKNAFYGNCLASPAVAAPKTPRPVHPVLRNRDAAVTPSQ
uniref:Putative secreted protein n=1 Tax=Ixodes scapularis TaxID=6945 RepID=A0A4D5RFV3_IXOSC